MSASPSTAAVENSNTFVPSQDNVDELHLSQLHGASAIIDDKLEDKILDHLQQLEDEWQHDPVNPRNWSLAKKWTATTIVSPSIRTKYLIMRFNFGFRSAGDLHFCDSVSKFYYGTWIARPGRKI